MSRLCNLNNNICTFSFMFFGYRLKLLTLKNIQSATAVSELGVVVNIIYFSLFICIRITLFLSLLLHLLVERSTAGCRFLLGLFYFPHFLSRDVPIALTIDNLFSLDFLDSLSRGPLYYHVEFLP
jgi:hypothetical protein